MKKSIIALIGILVSILSCEKKEQEVPVSSVAINKTTAELLIGETVQLSATVSPADATQKSISWASSNQSVASVSGSGMVTAIAEGSSTITASAGGRSATCSVTVKKKTVEVASVELNKSELALTVGDSETLVATVKPDDATDKTVTWTTSDATIATVENGKVTAKKEGEAIVTAKAGSKSATCKVTITKIPVESVTLDKTSIKLGTGQTATIVATVSPTNASYKQVTWSSSDETVASVDEKGTVTALKKGETTISATADGKVASCTVTVYTSVESVSIEQTELKLVVGNTFKLTGVINPQDADIQGEITWKSSEETVASVNNEGLVTAIKEGEVTITFSVDGKSATCFVKCEKASGSNEDMGNEDWK